MTVLLQSQDVPSQISLEESVGRLRKDADLMSKARGKTNLENEKNFLIVANFLEMLAKRVKESK